MEAEAVPHLDYLFVDQDLRGEFQVLTHTETLESVALPQRGHWELAYDPEGFATLFCDDRAQKEFEPEHFLKLQLCVVVGTERRFYKPVHSTSKNDATFLDSPMRTFEARTVSIKLGPCRGLHSFDIVVCERPRQGFKCFFSAVSVYNGLSYDMYKGCASRWAWQQVGAFEKFCSDLCPQQVQRSMPYQNATVADDDKDARVFPWHAWSSAALVALMARLCAAPRRAGGLESDRCRQATSMFLDAIVEQVCRGRVLMMKLCLEDDWEWRWPRPSGGEEHLDFLVEASVGVEHVCLGSITIAWRYDSVVDWLAGIGDVPCLPTHVLLMAHLIILRLVWIGFFS